MKTKSKVLSAFCAMIMSASVVMPVFAVSPDRIDCVETRLKEASDRLNHSVLNAGGEEKKEIEKLLNDTKLSLDSNRTQLSLLSDDDEKAQSTFLSLHNNIDHALNIIDISDLSVGQKVKIYVLDEKKLSCLRTKVDSIRETKCGSEHEFIYQRYRQVVERFYHLDVCFGRSDQDFDNASDYLSLEHREALIDKFERNKKEVNKYLEKIIKDIDDAVKMDNLDVFNQLIEEIHDNINMHHIYLGFFDDNLKLYKEIDNKKEEKKTKKSTTKKDINEQITEFKSPEIENGIYTIESKLDNNKCLDIQNANKDDWANLQLFEKNSTEAQKFEIKYNKEAGYYTITAMCSKKPLDVALAGKDWGTNIQQYSYNDNDAQKWYIVSDGQGYYSIVSKCNGLYMDVSNANTANGTNIQCWDMNGTDAQKFKLVKS